MDTAARRRRLSDLNTLGRPLIFADDSVSMEPKLDETGAPVLDEGGHPVMEAVAEPPVTAWVAKLNSTQMTDALKKAAQAQAVAMTAGRDHESESWQAMYAETSNLGREAWVEMLVDLEMIGRREMIEARVAAQTEVDAHNEKVPGKWAKDGYLDGLRDAWEGGLQATHATDPDNLEAVRVLTEISSFNAEVDQEYEDEVDIERVALEALSDEALIAKTTDFLVRSEAQSVWSEEYRRRVVYLATRTCQGPAGDPEDPSQCMCVGKGRRHRNRYFESYDEVLDTDDEIVSVLYFTWESVMVDVREGKGWRATLSSSPPSGSPSAEAISISSGQEDASA